MDTRTLEFLVAVVDAGSMSAAANRLGTTRSNVSRRLKMLERSMRVQVLRRTTRRLEPTQLGWAMYEHAVQITRQVAALHATMEDMGRSLRGHLRVSMPVGLGQVVLGPLMIEFCERYPEVTMQLTFSNRVFDLLAEEIDVAIRIAASPPESYVARELADVAWILCVSPSYLARHGSPVEPRDLGRHSVVTPPVPSNRLRLQMLANGHREIVDLMPRLQCSDMQFLKRAVIAGNGLGVLPHYLVSAELSDGSLARALPDHQVDSQVWGDKLYLITTPSLYPTLAVRTLIEFVREHCTEGAIVRPTVLNSS